MKVRVTFDLSDADREAISDLVGKAGRAPHARCRSYIESVVRATLDDIVSEMEEERERRRDE